MVKVSIEVRNGAACFCVAVRAQSIERALSLAQELYPGGDCQAKFPIDPDGFFDKDCAARAGLIGFELPEQMAA